MLNFNKEKKMKKEDKIKEIRRLAEQELPAMIKNCQVNQIGRASCRERVLAGV